MDKGIKKLQKHVEKIEQANNQIIEKVLRRALKLKKTKLSDISYRKNYVTEILIHKDTNNFPVTKQRLLNKLAELHDQYPYITICFDPNQNHQPVAKDPMYYRMIPGGLISKDRPLAKGSSGSRPSSLKRYLPSQNENRLILTLNWEDYMQHALQSVEFNNSGTAPIPRLGVEDELENITKKNTETIQNALQQFFSTAKDHSTEAKTEHAVRLVENTMKHEVTRNHYTRLSQQIMKRYNGVVEMFHTKSSVITIRIHWNIYLAQIAAEERRNRHHVPLLSDTHSTFHQSLLSKSSHTGTGAVTSTGTGKELAYPENLPYAHLPPTYSQMAQMQAKTQAQTQTKTRPHRSIRRRYRKSREPKITYPEDYQDTASRPLISAGDGAADDDGAEDAFLTPPMSPINANESLNFPSLNFPSPNFASPNFPSSPSNPLIETRVSSDRVSYPPLEPSI